ncbi:hypothetical protein [Burkholderia ubonensis]|uniref:hypothetical protein n=1 Tax=Burkholderia ubonensis TaxID=101571 RepID=UPI002ABE5CF0|nr:hypothetical protein [Burkholderia ubonensis]
MNLLKYVMTGDSGLALNPAWRTFSLIAAHSTLAVAGHALGKAPRVPQFGPAFEHLESAFGLARDCIKLGLETVAPLFAAEKT